MSYNIDLPCGCVVYVSCHPVTGLAHTRVIQMRSTSCPRRRHEVGARLFLWELLPDRHHRAHPVWSDEVANDHASGGLDGATVQPARSIRDRRAASTPDDTTTAATATIDGSRRVSPTLKESQHTPLRRAPRSA
jgi:hypothetical protein